MKLSLVFELLLIFVLLAFAASKSVGKNKQKGIQNRNDGGISVAISDEKQQDESSLNSINKYCKCSESFCNCCRNFAVPYVNLDGPGCASLRYLNGDKMSVSLSFGKKVITNQTLASRKPSPVCMPLPGGISKFCGRVYNIARTGEEFRACLGLELQSKKTVEAAVRVSCFKFGPRGVHAEPADPLPLVPQDEKADDDEDDDDDDDDDDDFGLGDDDDGDLDGINDVEGADYTGFSLLSEDLLGGLFGSGSSEKKSNKNRKKQAPLPSTTTTTKRPRTTRPRTTRRPNTRTTTPRIAPARTTTVRVRPNRRTRRPTRRPNRPNRNPTTSVTTSVAENSLSPSAATTATSTTAPPAANPTTAGIISTERIQFMSTANDDTYQPLVIVTQRPATIVSSSSTPKTTANFEDPGIEMSLAQLTGQLAAMPASPIIPEGAKDTGVMTSRPDLISYEKIETITPKGTTLAFTQISDDKVNDDMVQIVHSLDSSSEEQTSEKDGEETRSQKYLVPVPIHYEGLTLPKRERQFRLEDLDVLDLSEIGETVGDQLGLFGRNKRQNKVQTHNNNKNPEPESEDDDDDDDSSEYDVLGLEQIGETVGEQIGLFGRGKRQKKFQETNVSIQKDNNDYDVLGLDAIGETLALDRSVKNKENNKRDRRRQNKMMRGDWSLSNV